MVMSHIIVQRILERSPETKIDMLAPRASLPLVERMPDVQSGILIDQGHGELGLGYRRSLGEKLSSEDYDQAIVTPNSFKSALVPFFAGIPLRTGFLGEYRYFLLNDIRLLDKKRMPRMVDRFAVLSGPAKPGTDIKSNETPVLSVDKDNQERLVGMHGLKAGGSVTGICPGAEFGDAKKWPDSHYITLCQSLVAKGDQVWIFGSPADEECGSAIAEAVGEGARNLAGKTTLPDAIDLLALCNTVVTNDSGLMHIAAAVGSRVVALYGSTSPEFTPPLSVGAEIVSLNLECSPCFKRECPLGHKNCLVNLTADQVVEVVNG